LFGPWHPLKTLVRFNSASESLQEIKKMPTVLRYGPYRFFFVALDRGEPAHIHVQRDKLIAKFWIDPIILQNSGGFTQNELSKIAKVIDEKRHFFMEK
jgi:hypothetical protein